MERAAVLKACAALRRGYTIAGAAARAGVSRATLHVAMNDERWRDMLCLARDEGDAALERVVLKAARSEPDGKMALDVLSRRRRAWQRKDNVRADVTLKPSAPKSREEAEAQCAAMMAAFAKDDDA